MNSQLSLMAVLCTMLIAVQCIPMHLQYLDNGILIRSRRSPNQGLLMNGYYGQPEQQNGFINEPQAEGEYGLFGQEGHNGEVPHIGHDNGHIGPQHGPNHHGGESDVPIFDESAHKEVTHTPGHADDSDEDDESDDWPISKSNKHRPHFNFFPVMFGGHGSRSGGFPGGATAIANSFSTGKGGVANSHAMAFGDPAAFRGAFNGNERFPPQN